ncbi:MAG: hypothetical protein QF879_13560 [Candidatus Latescibacteria bacterium]|jgi:hypothetical protein|nr:hypothetical protein [Candidatus Latescibacterota bacterium]
MKDDALNIRISSENKKRLTIAAHDCGRSLAGVVLYSTNMYFAMHCIDMAKRFQKVRDAMKPGGERDKIQEIINETLAEGEYFTQEFRAVQESSEMLKEIEGIENYRDLMRSTVAAETAT